MASIVSVKSRISIKYLLNLIESKNIINHQRIYTSTNNLKTNIERNRNKKNTLALSELEHRYNNSDKTNIMQFLKNEDDTYSIYYFDSYGIKLSKKTLILKRVDFIKALIRYIKSKRHLFQTSINHYITYHKKRVSRKAVALEKNIFISNEEDIKAEVYNWLISSALTPMIVIPEFSIGKNRVDYISFDINRINTVLVEIKSGLDNFNRLQKQLDSYNKIGSYVYIALDIKKYNELIKKDISVPSNVGILVYDNSKPDSKKLKEVKKAKKNIFNKDVFISYLSYSDWVMASSGFKYSSKFSKEQFQNLVQNNISKDALIQFSYDALIMRYKKESDLRKEYFPSDIKKSVGSSKNIGIDRFSSSSFNISLKDYINNDLFLYKEYMNKKDIFLEVFKELPNIEKILKKKNHHVVYSINRKIDEVFIYNNNELSIIDDFLKSQDLIKKYWNDLDLDLN